MSDSQQYLYLIQPTRLAMLTDGPTPQEEETVSRHFDYLKAIADQGIVILAGRTLNTAESSFGIVIFRAESEEAARAVMNNDPAAQAGVIPWPDRQGRLAPALRPALGGLHRPCRPSRTSAGVRARLFPYRIALMADREVH